MNSLRLCGGSAATTDMLAMKRTFMSVGGTPPLPRDAGRRITGRSRLRLRADGAEQQVIDYLASPEQVHLPQQKARGGLLTGGRTRRTGQPPCGKAKRGRDHTAAAHRDLHLGQARSEEHTSELQSLRHLVC